jgi:hypothetical protein
LEILSQEKSASVTFSLWQKIAHFLRLQSQYSTFEIFSVYSPYKLDPEKSRQRQKNGKNKKTGLITKTQSGQTAEGFRQGQTQDCGRIQQAGNLFAGKGLLTCETCSTVKE